MKPMAFHVAAFLVLLGLCSEGSAARAKTIPVNPNVCDFGVVRTGEAVRHIFLIENKKARKPVEIKAARSSCDDVQILSYPRIIAPGETGKLELRWIPSRPGRVSNEVWLETNLSSGTPLRFVLEGSAEGDMPREQQRPVSSKIPGEWFTRVLKKRDSSLFISVESVRRDFQQETPPRIVDIRSQEAFDQSRIPGSLNMPLFSVRSREFLKSSRIIIVGSAHDYGKLESECRRLRDLGFTASILEGGIDHWTHTGYPVEGTLTSGQRLNSVSPREFFEERHFENWVLVNACQLKREEGRYFIPQAHLLMNPEKTEELVSRLNELVSIQKESHNIFLIFFDDNGGDVLRLARALRNSEYKNAYFLDGGIEGYRTFLEDQAALVRAQSDTGKEAMAPCPNCPHVK
jgi:rhodanese-related sulfurtransferase